MTAAATEHSGDRSPLRDRVSFRSSPHSDTATALSHVCGRLVARSRCPLWARLVTLGVRQCSYS